MVEQTQTQNVFLLLVCSTSYIIKFYELYDVHREWNDFEYNRDKIVKDPIQWVKFQILFGMDRVYHIHSCYSIVVIFII